MLHLWLIPALAVLVVAFWGFYLVVRSRGGTGARTDGQKLVDRPDENEPDENG
jgi:hypothetical protein